LSQVYIPLSATTTTLPVSILEKLGDKSGNHYVKIRWWSLYILCGNLRSKTCL